MKKTGLQIENARRNAEEIARERTELSTRPSHLFVELTRSCNLRCFMCARTAAGLGRQGPDMPWFLFERVEKELFPRAVLAELNGLGESPLMARWPQVLERVGRHAIHPLIVSNGQVLDWDTIAFFVERGGILRISVDAAQAPTFETLRRGARFERLLSCLTLIRRAARSRPGTGFALDFATVLSRDNLDQLGGIVRLAARFGVRTIHMQHLVPFSEEATAKSLTRVPELANEALARVQLVADSLGVGLVLPAFFDGGNVAALRTLAGERKASLSRADEIVLEHRPAVPAHCMEPWTTTYVEHDGAVKPCCVSETVLGNLNELPFSDIWNGSEYQALRAQLLGREPLADPSCRRCYAIHDNQLEALLQAAPQKRSESPAE